MKHKFDVIVNGVCLLCGKDLENGLYYVTWMHNDSCYICLKEFADGRWKSTLNIIAWMPCPKPCTKKNK